VRTEKISLIGGIGKDEFHWSTMPLCCLAYTTV